MTRINLKSPKYIGYRLRKPYSDDVGYIVWLDVERGERLTIEMPNDSESYSTRSQRSQAEQDRFDYLTGGKPT